MLDKIIIMLFEPIALTVILLLLAVICFLLYKLYRINYTNTARSSFIPESLKRDIMNLDENKESLLEMRVKDIGEKIHEIEKKLEKQEMIIENLVEELGG